MCRRGHAYTHRHAGDAGHDRRGRSHAVQRSLGSHARHRQRGPGRGRPPLQCRAQPARSGTPGRSQGRAGCAGHRLAVQEPEAHRLCRHRACGPACAHRAPTARRHRQRPTWPPRWARRRRQPWQRPRPAPAPVAEPPLPSRLPWTSCPSPVPPRGSRCAPASAPAHGSHHLRAHSQARAALAAMESSGARWSDVLVEGDLRALLEARATTLLREEEAARQEAAAAFMVRQHCVVVVSLVWRCYAVRCRGCRR